MASAQGLQDTIGGDAFMLAKLKLIGLAGILLFTALCLVMPMQLVQACDAWPGGGLDDATYQNLYGLNAPLNGRDQIDRAAARALNDAWVAAGRPENFDASPYFKSGPDCEGGPGSASLATTTQQKSNKQDNQDNDNRSRNSNDND
ncbi:MAG TPA: hypothetical protein VHX16_02455 [Chloroflexota bacterium]|jgi:hypothetical protein|nr:hypothetical protein [Chloroflexota bacterium]